MICSEVIRLSREGIGQLLKVTRAERTAILSHMRKCKVCSEVFNQRNMFLGRAEPKTYLVDYNKIMEILWLDTFDPESV